MITVVYGTTGELIKLAPLLKKLEQRGTPALTLCTGQQIEQIPELLRDFGLRQPDIWLARGVRGRDLSRPRQIPGWVCNVAASWARQRTHVARTVRAQTQPIVIVHGDTFTTVLGAMIGRTLGEPVAHIEAGLRSGDWRNPFPEEVDRRLASRLATIHYAPGPWAATNLRRGSTTGEIIDTGANTIRDAIELGAGAAPSLPLPRGAFGIASLHRFELLNDAAALRAIVELLRDASRTLPVLFVDHPVTAAALRTAKLDDRFDDRLVRIPRQKYFPFLALLVRSAFLVTDSGGSQEECAALGHPCLVHRARTERLDGLDSCVELSKLDLETVRGFLEGPWEPALGTTNNASPTQVILDHLERQGHLTRH